MWYRYTFDKLISTIKGRLSQIDFERGEYKYNVNREVDIRGAQSVTIFYKNKEIMRFLYYITNIQTADNEHLVSGCMIIRIKNESDWYNKYDKNKNIIIVTELGHFSYKTNKDVCESKAMDDLFPLSNDSELHKISNQLNDKGLYEYEIKFDTLNNRYIIFGDISNILGLTEADNISSDIFLYKYMSLSTYFSMLKNTSYRMNSITSMNDESESFFLNDDLFELYSGKGKEERYGTLIENSRILISSFTDKNDNSLMWQLYGDFGKGICLRFRINKDQVKKIHYIDERSEGYIKLKKIVQVLKSDNIEIIFSDADKYKFYMKSDGFKHEDEYRLTHICEDEKLSWTMYGNLISPYRDFSLINGRFEELGLRICSVTIGAKIPNFEVNYPLLVELTNKTFGVELINISEHNKFRES